MIFFGKPLHTFPDHAPASEVRGFLVKCSCLDCQHLCHAGDRRRQYDRFHLLGTAGSDEALVQRPSAPRPLKIDRAKPRISPALVERQHSHGLVGMLSLISQVRASKPGARRSCVVLKAPRKRQLAATPPFCGDGGAACPPGLGLWWGVDTPASRLNITRHLLKRESCKRGTTPEPVRRHHSHTARDEKGRC
jgi:hypothetical protein